MKSLVQAWNYSNFIQTVTVECKWYSKITFPSLLCFLSYKLWLWSLPPGVEKQFVFQSEWRDPPEPTDIRNGPQRNVRASKAIKLSYQQLYWKVIVRTTTIKINKCFSTNHYGYNKSLFRASNNFPNRTLLAIWLLNSSDLTFTSKNIKALTGTNYKLVSSERRPSSKREQSLNSSNCTDGPEECCSLLVLPDTRVGNQVLNTPGQTIL